ncbi:MAG: MarR family transcriptional regulator [Nitrospiraceae bacterium]|nr:MarR family transcriptional regulator [Nitrospiraceae bacterium]
MDGPAYFDPNESLGFHCNLTVKAFLSKWERKLRGTGVSLNQLVALGHLIASGPLGQSELVGRLSITGAAGVRLVDRMEHNGWVRREPDPKDGRVKLVVPTDKAIQVWKEVSRTGGCQAVLDQAYRGIEPAEIETVKRVLEKIRKNLEK